MVLPNAVLYVEKLSPDQFFDRMSEDERSFIFNPDELEHEFELGHQWLIIGQAVIIGGLHFLARRVVCVQNVLDDAQPVKTDAH